MRSSVRAVIKQVRSKPGKALSRAASSQASTSYAQATHPDEPAPADVAEKLKRHSKVTLNTYARPSLIFTKGKGSKIWDSQDREYLDMTAGIAVNALGHSDEQVAAVMSDQATKLVHCSNLFHNEWSGELADLIVSRTKQHGGMGFPDPTSSSTATVHPSDDTSGLKVFFANAGTEANEGAIKFARKYGKTKEGKHEFVCFADGFHGRSMGALSATSQPKYQEPFAPLIPGFKAGKLNDIDSIEELVDENTCGVIVEPIQGEGGIMEANEPFLKALRKKCTQVGAALIYDEIQCGLGRTGKLWAHSLFPTDCHPDMLTMAKPLANGLCIGAILMKDEIADVIKLGDHGTTFGGQPLQTRVAHHVLGRIADFSFLDHVNEIGDELHGRLSRLQNWFPNLIAGPVRGRGLMLGVPTKHADYPGKIAKLCRERGLLVLTCGNATMRFVPSLIISKEEMHKGCDIFESALNILNEEHVEKQPPSGQMMS